MKYQPIYPSFYKTLNFTNGSSSFNQLINHLVEIKILTELLMVQIQREVSAFQVKLFFSERKIRGWEVLMNLKFSNWRSIEKIWFQPFTAFTMFTLIYNRIDLGKIKNIYFSSLTLNITKLFIWGSQWINIYRLFWSDLTSNQQ